MVVICEVSYPNNIKNVAFMCGWQSTVTYSPDFYFILLSS